MFKDKKVVVTGGSGFIGTHFINELLDRGAQVKTYIHNTPLKINPLSLKDDERIEVLQNINLEKLEDAIKLIDGGFEHNFIVSSLFFNECDNIYI